MTIAWACLWALILPTAIGCGGSPSTTAEGTEETGGENAGGVRAVTTGDATEAVDFFAVPDDTGLQNSGRLLPSMPVAVTSFGAVAADGNLYVLGGYAGMPHVYNSEGQSKALWRLDLNGSAEGSAGWTQVDEAEHGVQGAPLFTRMHDGQTQVCRLGGTQIDNGPGEPLAMRSLDSVRCFDGNGWHDLTPMPEARSSFEVAQVGDELCAVGGWRMGTGPADATWSESMHCLNLTSGVWRAIDAPMHRRALAVAAVGQKLMAIGGLDDQRSVSSAVDIYDFAAGTWSEGPAFPEPAFGVAATAHDGAIYASARSGRLYRWRDGDTAWTQVGSLAYHRFFHQLVSTENGIVALGGAAGMDAGGRVRHVELLTPGATDSERVAVWSIPWQGTSKNRQAVFVVGEQLYLYGGNNSLGQHDFEPENFVAEGWRVHLPSMRVAAAGAYPAARQTMSVVAAGDAVFALGGFGHDGEHAVTQQDVYRFDAEEEGWQRAGVLPTGRTQFGAANIGDELFLFGGLNYDPRREGEAAFDHVTNIWRRTAEATEDAAFTDHTVPMPAPRRAFAGAVSEDGSHYYIVGGMRAGFQLVDDCLDYDVQAEYFGTIPCPSAPRLSGDLVALGGRLYLAGGSVRGEEGIEESRTIEVFDPAHPDAGWQLLTTLPFSMRHARTLAYDGRLLIVSTHFEEARLQIAVVDVSEAVAP